MNEAQIEAGFKKHVQEVIDDGEHPDDVVSFPSFRAGIEFAKSVLSVSDGLEHSQHKCGEEIAELKRQLDGATFVQKKWDEREEVIKAYREALTEISRSATNHRGYMFDIAKEVLTRMEGKG